MLEPIHIVRTRQKSGGTGGDVDDHAQAEEGRRPRSAVDHQDTSGVRLNLSHHRRGVPYARHELQRQVSPRDRAVQGGRCFLLAPPGGSAACTCT